MQNAEDEDVRAIDRVDYHMVIGCQASPSRAEFCIPGASRMWKGGECEKPLCDVVDDTIRDRRIAPFGRDPKPDLVQIGFRFRRP